MEGCGVALLTGGTKGIGLATAQEMVNMGYRQFILGYHKDDAAAQKAKVDLEQTAGVKIALVKGDISDKSTIEAHFRAIEEQFDGKLFAIIHVAGEYIMIDSADRETILNKYQDMYGKALWRLVERGVPYMEKCSHGGRIIAVSSPGVNIMSSPLPDYFLPGYGKSSMEYMTRNYALKLAPKKITCNIVIPGITQTTAWEQLGLSPADVELMAERRCPMKKVIPPKAIGEVIAFLVSEKASFITGAILPVDGGFCLHDGDQICIYTS